MKDRTYESITSEDEVCCIIGQAVIELERRTAACHEIYPGTEIIVNGGPRQ